MVIFYSYVSLPEGILEILNAYHMLQFMSRKMKQMWVIHAYSTSVLWEYPQDGLYVLSSNLPNILEITGNQGTSRDDRDQFQSLKKNMNTFKIVQRESKKSQHPFFVNPLCSGLQAPTRPEPPQASDVDPVEPVDAVLPCAMCPTTRRQPTDPITGLLRSRDGMAIPLEVIIATWVESAYFVVPWLPSAKEIDGQILFFWQW